MINTSHADANAHSVHVLTIISITGNSSIRNLAIQEGLFTCLECDRPIMTMVLFLTQREEIKPWSRVALKMPCHSLFLMGPSLHVLNPQVEQK